MQQKTYVNEQVPPALPPVISDCHACGKPIYAWPPGGPKPTNWLQTYRPVFAHGCFQVCHRECADHLDTCQHAELERMYQRALDGKDPTEADT